MFIKNLPYVGIIFVMSSGFCDKNVTAPLVEYLSTNVDDIMDNSTWQNFTVIKNQSSHSDESVNASMDKCSSDLIYLRSSIKEEWALKMLDSFGKPGSGLLYGASDWLGNYEECLDVLVPPGVNTTGFKGQYWMLGLKSKIPMVPVLMASAVCIPNSCQEKDLRVNYDLILSLRENLSLDIKLNATSPLVQVKRVSDSVVWSWSAIIFTAFLACLAFLVLLASLYDLYLSRSLEKSAKTDKEILLLKNCSSDKIAYGAVAEENISSSKSKKFESLLLCFSAVRNGSSIMDTSSKKGQMDCLHGIRVLSMAWVIFVHTHELGIPQWSNKVSLFKLWNSSFALQIVARGTFSVESFFVLSGFLLAYIFLKDGIRKMEAKDWANYYIHRYIRLTPPYALMIGIWTTISYMYVRNGIFLDSHVVNRQKNCQTNWWWNMLYINNLQNDKEKCMIWSWYLANDMQFFVISPIFLVCLQRWPKLGCASTFATIVASSIIVGIVGYQNKNSLYGEKYISDSRLPVFTTGAEITIYGKPYARIGSYLIGILVAFCYLKFRTTNMKKWVVILGWTVTTIFITLPVFGVYNQNPDVLATAIYDALARHAFALGVGWMIFACLTGNGGPVNWILSWKLWLPLSRMNYCAYLVHCVVIQMYFQTLKHALYFSEATMVVLFFGFLLMIYGAAFLATLTLESPFAALEKLLINK